MFYFLFLHFPHNTDMPQHIVVEICKSYLPGSSLEVFFHHFHGPFRCPPGKISSFSGSEDWATWITQFEVIAKRFRWSEEEMLDQLLPRIEGPAAQFVFSQLRQDILNNYRDLTYKLSCRFQPIETARSFASKFSRRN